MTEPSPGLIERARKLLDRGIDTRSAEKELRSLGASRNDAKRAVHAAMLEVAHA